MENDWHVGRKALVILAFAKDGETQGERGWRRGGNTCLFLVFPGRLCSYSSSTLCFYFSLRI